MTHMNAPPYEHTRQLPYNPDYNNVYPSIPESGDIYSNPVDYELPANYPHVLPPVRHPTIPIVTNTVVVKTVSIGPLPVRIQCPHCHDDIVTMTIAHSGRLTWILCVVLLILGFWICCCIPCCLRSCKDIVHSCPSCKKYIATHRRL